MKITYNWLREFVKFDYTPQELAEHLTMLGLEVELVVPIKPLFSKVVVGKILEIVPHPNSKKLLLCKVTTGAETLQIICGADNISAGDLVPSAVIGAVLADNTNITKRNILGIDSYGMLCSEKELGLHDSAHGILILSEENTNRKTLKLGSPLEKELNLEDTVFDINVTPNRGDALSIIGIAREVSAITGNPVIYPKTNFAETNPSTKELVKIEIKSPKYCPRYTARIIKNIQVKPSPFWMRYRIGLVGIRPVNNIVDITNYVLAELGQPLHAFDYNTIKDRHIIVRTAEQGEQILTIDNETRKLDNDMLVIADKNEPIAIAGIMGGKGTEVGEKTTDILLESAYFEPANIRRTSKKLGVTTESSYRFERAIDPESAPSASDRAVHIIQSMTGGIVSKKIIDFKKNLPKIPSIIITHDYCSRILGTEFTAQKISTLLGKLGCAIKKSGNVMSVKPPSWRQDIKKNIDLTEEIARLNGYPNIPSLMPEAMVISPKRKKQHELIKKLYGLLTGMGLSEIITYSFINPNDVSLLRMPETEYIKLTNPIDKNVCAMRTTLVPGIINTILYNLNRNNDAVHIFEIGRYFSPDKTGKLPRETLKLCMGITGNPTELHWRRTELTVDFFYLKGIIEELMRKLFIKNFQITKTENPAYLPGRSCGITAGDKYIGIFGELHPQILRELGIKDETRKIYISEINIEMLEEAIPNDADRQKFRQLPKFPSVRRDVSIILDKDTESYDIIKLVKGIHTDIIEDIRFFDIYSGSPIPQGKKSITFAVIYRHKEKTLKDEEVDNIHNLLRSKILENIKCEIRE